MPMWRGSWTTTANRFPIVWSSWSRRLSPIGSSFRCASTTAGTRLPQYNGWTGPFLPREVVERIGLPMAELFWWREDAEYLALRPQRLGIPVVTIEAARLANSPVRRMQTKPAWKFYYETRNIIYYRLYLYRSWYGACRLLRTLAVNLAVIVFREPDKRRKLEYYVLGVFDGVRGKLGTRVPAAAFEDTTRYDAP